MTTFIRLLDQTDKQHALLNALRGLLPDKVFEVEVSEFSKIPGAPFTYWLPNEIRMKFQELGTLQNADREARHGGATLDDFRFLRSWTEVGCQGTRRTWMPILKGGSIPPFATPIYMVLNWSDDGRELKSYVSAVRDKNGWGPNWTAVLNGYEYYGTEGITWSARPHRRGYFAHVPPGCIFSHTGMMLFLPRDQHWTLLAITNSTPFIFLLHSLMARGTDGGQTLKYESGYVGIVPVPDIPYPQALELSELALMGWKYSRRVQSYDETSQFFVSPFGSLAHDELSQVLSQIDDICFKAYGFSLAAKEYIVSSHEDKNSTLDNDEIYHGDYNDDDDDDDGNGRIDDDNRVSAIISWSVGVSFGRFDIRVATGEITSPPEPEPFDPLPAISPGMLPDGAEPFHRHAGILVDDPGHKHDLAQLIEVILTRVDAPVSSDVRRWLQREFFPSHLQRYTKSRRKAPIYWPLSTASGGYTLWLYYPDLNSQTLFTAVNDFIEPKLEHVGKEVAALRNKGSARSRDDDKAMETFQALEKELTELRDTLLQIAPTYRPNHDDGVQIAAAPLWPLFRHKPWQKLLKETWEKLEKGAYDWSHIAMRYWPDRVREKCKADQSLAIAHGLEELYEPPPASTAGPGGGGRKRRGAAQ